MFVGGRATWWFDLIQKGVQNRVAICFPQLDTIHNRAFSNRAHLDLIAVHAVSPIVSLGSIIKAAFSEG